MGISRQFHIWCKDTHTSDKTQWNENLIYVTVVVETSTKVADTKDIGIPLPAYSWFPLYFEKFHEWDTLNEPAAVTKFVKEHIRESFCVVTGCEPH